MKSKIALTGLISGVVGALLTSLMFVLFLRDKPQEIKEDVEKNMNLFSGIMKIEMLIMMIMFNPFFLEII